MDTQNILAFTPGGGGWLPMAISSTGTNTVHTFDFDGGNTDCDLLIIPIQPINMTPPRPFAVASPTTPIT